MMQLVCCQVQQSVMLHAIQEEQISFESFRGADSDEVLGNLIKSIDRIIKNIFSTIYPTSAY